MEHRGTARSRIVRVLLDDGAPDAGAAVVAADKPVGTMGSSAAGHGLALLRLDRAADAIDAGIPLTAGGIPIRVADPDDLKLSEKKTVA
jgi:folate-binding Fe-S cluster repair protein YgfZ